MPIPSRRKGQKKDDFLTKCIAQLSGEYSQKQAAAICYQQMKMYKGEDKSLDDIYNRIKK